MAVGGLESVIERGLVAKFLRENTA